ncbi:MAG: FAD-dependent oxidoreductase [Actinobacteria bacterium]|nr:FAD-dependent oxidoreductase [Actinomycetota bacterium]
MSRGSPAAQTVHPSLWFSALGELPTRPALPGPLSADVCIVGAGLTGLWAALELCRAEPGLDVVVLEREHVGFGASGRNGGWLMGELGGDPGAWAARGGDAAAAAQGRAIAATVAEVGRALEKEGIDCDFLRCGALDLAQTPVEWDRLRARFAAAEAAAGPGGRLELLDAAAARARVDVAGLRGAIFDPGVARVQPAKLVLGLAAAAERAGARIFERTAVAAIEPGRARTAAGEVEARWVIRATEAYGAEFADRRREVVPINSALIATERLDQRAWERLGWRGPELLSDGAHMYVYLQRTADGRVVIGGRGVPYRYGSRTQREGAVPRHTVVGLRRRLIRLFPRLAEARIECAWHGVLGFSRDWMPAVGVDRRTGEGWAVGYGGEGLAAANLAGRTLRDLILGRETELTGLPWVGPPARRWEPEPLRFLGIRTVYSLLGGADALERRSGRPSRLAAVADRLAGRS